MDRKPGEAADRMPVRAVAADKLAFYPLPFRSISAYSLGISLASIACAARSHHMEHALEVILTNRHIHF
jgi:hypothetical protein